MKILTPSERSSEKIIRKIAADILNIPETDETLHTAAHDGHTSCDACKECEDCKECLCEGEKKTAGVNCPQCGGVMQMAGNMSRCACGYAQANTGGNTPGSPITAKTAATRKSAKEISIEQYYKQIYPDDYAAELTRGTPKSTTGKGKVQYGNVPVDKKVNAGVDTAGECEVKDAHPESGVSSGSGGERQINEQSAPSANSVYGPERAKSHGTGLSNPSDLSNKDENTATAKVHWLSREVVAQFCPPCAEEMSRRGIARISAQFMAKKIAERAEQRGFTVDAAGRHPITDPMPNSSQRQKVRENGKEIGDTFDRYKGEEAAKKYLEKKNRPVHWNS